MSVKHLPVFGMLCVVLLIAGFLVYANKNRSPELRDSADRSEKSFTRIISLSPSITETLFVLGLSDRVIGVTRFCMYPPEARLKQDVGGYVDPNYEVIASLKPDLVILLEEQTPIRNHLEGIGIRCLTVKNKTIRDIMETIITIGQTCGTEENATRLTDNIESRMLSIEKAAASYRKPRVLVSIGRSFGSGSLDEVYIAGRNTYYDEIITCAGGINAYDRRDIPYPVISGEGILLLDPDIIIDLVPETAGVTAQKEDLIRDWNSLQGVKAVSVQQVYIITAGYSVIPGPRFILLMEDFARLFHHVTGKESS